MAGAGPAVGAAVAVEEIGGGLGGGGGLAQGHGVAGAAGDLAPDDGGLQATLGAVGGADAAGGDVGSLGLGLQQFEVQQFQQRGVAAGQTITRGVQALSAKQTLKFSTELEHDAAPITLASQHGTPDLGSDRKEQSRVRDRKQVVNFPTMVNETLRTQ